jgi:hypothetical protein
MNEDLWYPWKASLVPQGIPVPQFENRWFRLLAVAKIVQMVWAETQVNFYKSGTIGDRVVPLLQIFRYFKSFL